MTTVRRSFGLMVIGCVLAATTDAGAVTLKNFGRCLKSKGATFYGTTWCPHCQGQRDVLGEAMDYVRYVECAVDGGREEAAPCRKAKIDGYPTWTFADGSRAGGKLSLERLAKKTGCELPDD